MTYIFLFLSKKKQESLVFFLGSLFIIITNPPKNTSLSPGFRLFIVIAGCVPQVIFCLLGETNQLPFPLSINRINIHGSNKWYFESPYYTNTYKSVEWMTSLCWLDIYIFTAYHIKLIIGLLNEFNVFVLGISVLWVYAGFVHDRSPADRQGGWGRWRNIKG